MNSKTMYEYEIFVEGRSGSKEKNTFTILAPEYLDRDSTFIANDEYFVVIEVDKEYAIVKSVTDSAVKVYKVV